VSEQDLAELVWATSSPSVNVGGFRTSEKQVGGVSLFNWSKDLKKLGFAQKTDKKDSRKPEK
jgi:hypothetical protein